MTEVAKLVRVIRFIIAEILMDWALTTLPQGKSKNLFAQYIIDYLEFTLVEAKNEK